MLINTFPSYVRYWESQMTWCVPLKYKNYIWSSLSSFFSFLCS